MDCWGTGNEYIIGFIEDIVEVSGGGTLDELMVDSGNDS